MKHPWLAYAIVSLVSIGAGVAIAGLPDNTSADVILVPVTTEPPAPTTTEEPSPATTTTEPAPETTEASAATTTTEPAPEATEASANTTKPDTTDPAPGEIPDRSEMIVAAANGANVAGAAARAAVLLEELGYSDVLPLNGTDIVEFTVVYYADGFQEAGLRMAEDLDLLPEFVAPLDEVPAVIDLPDDVELLAYIGRDRA